MKKTLIAILLLSTWVNVYASPIEISNSHDYNALDRFFRFMFGESEYGYVLEGTKPVSIMNIAPFGGLVAPQALRFKTSTYAKEFMDSWYRLCPEQKNREVPNIFS